MNAVSAVDVAIAGAGPVGLTLANLLGAAGLSVVIVERNPGTVPEPRAIAIDGESLRTLQATGLADTVLETLREGFTADYVNGEGFTCSPRTCVRAPTVSVCRTALTNPRSSGNSSPVCRASIRWRCVLQRSCRTSSRVSTG
jgi:2-polyprenyl-6-methoxyphenol hydroxylase-like FAD-dependent oxidoreductase